MFSAYNNFIATNMKKLLGVAFAMMAVASVAQQVARYGTGLGADGSEKAIHTVFVCPGEDCSRQMRVSWATAPHDSLCVVTVVGADGKVAGTVRSTYRPCLTFDSIYSKLGDNSDVYERHNLLHHEAVIDGLDASADYVCRVALVDTAGRVGACDERLFRTAGNDTWKAAVIGDFHHYSPLWRRLDAAMAMVNTLDSVAGGVDWILSPGDQCAWGASYNYWTELSEQPAYRNYMWASVQGNHDHMSRNNVRTDNYFRDTHSFPANGYAGQEGVCYSFRYGDVLFIMLNNEAMHNAATLADALAWIRATVEGSDARYYVVVEHYEWLIGTDGSNSQLDRFRRLFDELGVDLAISGNNHVYLRTWPLVYRRPVDARIGTTYVVLPSSDDSRGRALKDPVANEDIIATRWSEGPHTVGGMVMDVTPERILMTLCDRHGNPVDTFAVPARR